MNNKPVQCPACGQPTTGKFCSHCGASLTGTVAPAPWNAQTIAPWAALGIASIALVVALMSLFSRDKGAVAPDALFPPLSSTVPVPGQLPDLASMSPRQAADRLFNRVMAASENGDTAEALRFAPMAIQAYDNLGTLDNDARYHVALIHMTAGDIDGARVQIEMLRKSVPNHLLGFMLEHQIAEQSGNKDSAARAYKAFLAAYDAEIAKGRAEYQDHQSSIERFREAAKDDRKEIAEHNGQRKVFIHYEPGN
jgi:tetratricopeptide (TPR) repeat protein